MGDEEKFDKEDGLERKNDGWREGGKKRNHLSLSLWLGFKNIGRRKKHGNMLPRKTKLKLCKQQVSEKKVRGTT